MGFTDEVGLELRDTSRVGGLLTFNDEEQVPWVPGVVGIVEHRDIDRETNKCVLPLPLCCF